MKLIGVFGLLLLLSVAFQGRVQAQSDTAETLQKKRLLISSFGHGVVYGSGLAGLSQLWYKNYQQEKFHLFNDSKQWRGQDKLGHAQTAYWLTESSSKAWQWAGLNAKQASLLGGGYALLTLGTIEVFDGFSSGWGFSLADMGANAAGIGVYTAQELLFQKQIVRLKFSVHGSPYAQYNPSLLGTNVPERIIKDYNGHSYWASINLHDLGISKSPEWLALSIGHNAFGMTGGKLNRKFDEFGQAIPQFQRESQLLLSFDIDLTRIKTKSPILATVFQTFAFIKIPLPAIGFRRDRLVWYGMYY